VFGVIHRRLSSLRDWEYAWITPVEIPSFVRDLGEPGSLEVEQGYQGAVHYIAGFLERFDFQLFRNGGLPLLERRNGALREEILFRFGPHPVRGTNLPLSIQVHIAHEGLREVRERYWPTAGRPPVSLISGNIGLVQNPPTYDIWNVATEDALPQLTKFMRDELIPFMDMLSSPSQLRRAIFDGEAPMFDNATAIEWLLTEMGRADARDFLKQILSYEGLDDEDFWRHHTSLRKSTNVGFAPGNPVRNLAVIAYSHDLCRRWMA
jgi:hypothetical protein